MDFLGMGWGEILIVLIVGLLVLGPDRLPEYARKLGRFVRNFRKVTSGLTRQVQDAINLDEDEDASRSIKKDIEEIKESLGKDAEELKKTLDDEAKAISETLESGAKEVSEGLNKEAQGISQAMSTEAQELKQTLEAQAQEVAKDLSVQASEGNEKETMRPEDKKEDRAEEESQDKPPIPVTPDSYG